MVYHQLIHLISQGQLILLITKLRIHNKQVSQFFGKKRDLFLFLAVGNVPSNEMSSMNMILLTSPSNSNEMSFEQNNSLLNESTDEVNLSSLSFLQTKQRRINHRRNKSEPVIIANLEELPSIKSLSKRATTILESSSTSTTSNESAITTNASYQNKRKFSTKNLSPSINSKQTKNGSSSQTQDKSSSSSSTTKKKKPWYNVS
jgi:hypothetical protein